MDTKAWGLQGLLEYFIEQFHKNMETALNSGALKGDEGLIVGRAVLVLTARQFAPASDYGKKVLHNLEYFI